MSFMWVCLLGTLRPWLGRLVYFPNRTQGVGTLFGVGLRVYFSYTPMSGIALGWNTRPYQSNDPGYKPGPNYLPYGSTYLLRR